MSTCVVKLVWCHADNVKRRMSPPPYPRFRRVSININVFFTRSRAATCRSIYQCVSPRLAIFFVPVFRLISLLLDNPLRALLHQCNHLLDIHPALHSCYRRCVWLVFDLFLHKSFAQLVARAFTSTRSLEEQIQFFTAHFYCFFAHFFVFRTWLFSIFRHIPLRSCQLCALQSGYKHLNNQITFIYSVHFSNQSLTISDVISLRVTGNPSTRSPLCVVSNIFWPTNSVILFEPGSNCKDGCLFDRPNHSRYCTNNCYPSSPLFEI